MHGLGNDYVYVNGFAETVPNPEQTAIKVSDRHFGIGSDGLILILPSETADVRMRMFNADGSEGEMCGNGIRCVAKYSFDHGLTKNIPIRVQTARGILPIDLQVEAGKVKTATVNMGIPTWDLPTIPVDPAHVLRDGKNVAYDILNGDRKPLARATFINVGNPHAVIFVPDVKSIDIEKLGPVLEKHPAFPKRANIHWVQVHSRNEVTMRTWERGSGVTLACGTGASAVCVAAVLNTETDRDLKVHLPGGDLRIVWNQDDNHVYMTGPATEVFSGEWNE